jgi:hypothetical protein
MRKNELRLKIIYNYSPDQRLMTDAEECFYKTITINPVQTCMSMLIFSKSKVFGTDFD